MLAAYILKNWKKAMTRHSFTALLGVLLFAASLTGQAANDTIRSNLFADADEVRQAAIEAEAALLAPRSFERAGKSYQSAEKNLARGQKVDRIRRDLDSAVVEYRKSITSAELAKVTFANMIKGRNDALAAQAPLMATELWNSAEREFRNAAIELEVGDLRSARKREASAETDYRDAELQAIKVSMLSETRRLLKEADDKSAGRYAPTTLRTAQALLIRAEKELEENRYDADLPRSLARQARYEALHAIYLAAYLRAARDSDLSYEDLVLEWERPIHEIAAAADLAAELDQGYAKPTAQIIEYIENLRIERHSLQQDLLEKDQRIESMQQEISVLDQNLGGAREERMALAQQLASQERVREQVKQVESMFSRPEALVFRDGNDIYIRLVGLNFEVGRAEIAPENYPLLSKVQDALRVFPEASMVVEGHTDSHGSDQTNLSLSQQRAMAVRGYLMNSMALNPQLITAVGYGESQPVANNETPEGRRRNRRIDIRIQPSADIH
jgi:outer membrane protein OmpA-like peptidoglycan-associated protein